MVSFRYRTATLFGNWCESEDQAILDATRARQVSRSLDDQRWQWAVPGYIEQRTR